MNCGYVSRDGGVKRSPLSYWLRNNSDTRVSKVSNTEYACWAVTAGIPVISAARMADQHQKLVVDFPLKPMAAEGLPGPPL